MYFRVFCKFTFSDKTPECRDFKPFPELARKHVLCTCMPGFTFPSKPSLHPDWQWVPQSAYPSGGAWLYYPMGKTSKKGAEGTAGNPKGGKGKGRSSSASPSSTNTGSPKTAGKGLKGSPSSEKGKGKNKSPKVTSQESLAGTAPAGVAPCEKGHGKVKDSPEEARAGKGKAKGNAKECKGNAKGGASKGKGAKQGKKGSAQPAEEDSLALVVSPASSKGGSSKGAKSKREDDSPNTGKALSPGSTTGSPKTAGTKGTATGAKGTGSTGKEGKASILRRANHVRDEPLDASDGKAQKALTWFGNMSLALYNALLVLCLLKASF